jgi:hypothetical protein
LLRIDSLGPEDDGQSPYATIKATVEDLYATMLVTRVEQWWVEAASAEEAQELLASGQGHHASIGERVHVELGMMSEDAA